MSVEKISKYAAVLLETSNGELIFHHRDNKPYIANPGMIGVFGGGVEDNETFENAVIREIKEELNINLMPEDLKFLFVYNKTKERHGIDQLCHVFLVKNVNINNLKLRPGEGQGIKIISRRDDLDKLKMTIMAKDIINKYFSWFLCRQKE